MILKIVMMLLKLISDQDKKFIVLETMGELVESRTSSIDKLMAEEVMRLSIKSTGNNITAFIVKE